MQSVQIAQSYSHSNEDKKLDGLKNHLFSSSSEFSLLKSFTYVTKSAKRGLIAFPDFQVWQVIT